MADLADTDGRNGRAAGGRFAPQNRYGKGNPNTRRAHELRAAVLSATTEIDVVEVVAKLKELALGGDVAAAKTYLDHILGRPAQAVEVSGPDGESLGITIEQIKTAILLAVGPDPQARARAATAFRNLIAQRAETPDADGE
jgi:hypothetical protein